MDGKYGPLLRARLHLDFIHVNSTTYSFLFGALAELMDNARDAGAARLDVFSVDNEELQGGFMLCFLDDGCGMSPEEASDIISFGTSKKRLSTWKFIGQYGNGLKSGSMRIGKDFILFTKKEETMTCLFFSQTFCEGEGLTEVVVPIPSWLTGSRKSVTDDPQKFSTELSIIYKYSPFKTEAELMEQFDMICGRCGTLLVIFNLKLLLSGEPELDIKTDKEDILLTDALEGLPERWSLRAYASVLYFEPRMRIFIQAKRVQTKHLCYSLYKPRKYHYVTYSFKGKLKNEVKKAEEAVKAAEIILKEIQLKANQPDRISSLSAKAALQKAVDAAEATHRDLKEKQRELKKARTLSLVFGVSLENRSQAGMFIYSNNRLIKMHERVGPQLKAKSLLGTGVIGIVNIPLTIMEPSHNKQEFLNAQEYNRLLRVMGQHLVQYCKDTGISNRNLSLFWNELRNQNKDMERSSEFIQYQRRQAVAIPLIVQCDLCLKWRVLPLSTQYREEDFLGMWICANNPNKSENSCHQVERLPSIPLGTRSAAPSSQTEKDRHLRECVQRYQEKLAEPRPQVSCSPSSPRRCSSCLHRVAAPIDSLPSPFLPTLSSSFDQKRDAESAESDVEFVAKTETAKSSRKKQRSLGPRGLGAALRTSTARRPQVRSFSCFLSTKPTIIHLVSMSLPSVPVEDLSPGLEPDVSSVSDSCQITSSPVMSSQSTSIKETVRKLMSNLREILLYFVPESQLTSAFNYVSVEELIGSPQMEQSPEKTNEKLKVCFSEIENILMVQYERNLKRRLQSMIYDSNRRGLLNEVYLIQCEHKRKLAEEKLNNLRAKLAVLLQKLQLGGPAGDLEQMDAYVEALLKSNTLP
uniref:MORC family CW-type zinc finger protein 1 n=1 Tax=Jaculus jaculus TaxID=51337 RepID=A0A8C5NVB5_JACJA